MKLKKTVFIGRAKSTLRSFPFEARKAAGREIQRVQAGKDPNDWKPMQGVGPGVKEIRLHQPHEHRVIYVASLLDAVYILHAFEKKTQKTPQRHIDTARAAYAELKKKK